MKQKLAAALLLLSAFSVFGQAIQRNYYTTNVNPALPSGATNGIFTLNGFGTNTTLYNLNVASVAAQWPSNSATATLATNSISTRFPTNVVFRVSSRGIANGLATIANNGANFGPDTSGTVTSGLQEAMDAATYVANAGPTVGGVTLELVDHAYYYFTNTLTMSNYFPRAITIKGQNLLSTKMVYAGPTNVVQTILFRGAGTPRALSLNIPVHLTISDIGFSSITNSTNILLRVTDYSDLNISRANFTSWQMMTNQVEGAGVSTDGNSTEGITQGSQVGLVMDSIDAGGDHGTSLNDLYFAGLATGLYAEADHVSARNLRFAHIGQFTNTWPATSPYSLGACILRSAGLDSSWDYLHFYSCDGGFVLLGEYVDTPLLNHANFESCQWPVTSLSTNTRAPLLRDPSDGFGSGSWVANSYYSLQVSNSPNYGYVGTAHPAAVTYGSDGFGAANDQKYWQIDIDGGSRLYFDFDGTDFGARINGVAGITAFSGNTIDLNPNSGLVIGEIGLVDYVSLLPTGDMSWTGVGSGLLDTTIATNAATDGYVLSATGNRLKWTPQTGGAATTITNSSDFPGVVVGGSGSFGIGTNLAGNGANFTNIPTILLAGTNIAILTNNGAGGRYTYTIHGTVAPGGGSVTLTNTTSAAGVITGSSPGTIFGIGTNLSASATNTFFRQDTTSRWTNLFGGYWSADTYNLIKVGTNANGTQFGEAGSSWLGNGMYIDQLTSANTYWIGNVGGPSSDGSFNLLDGTVRDITATSFIGGGSGLTSLPSWVITNHATTLTTHLPIVGNGGRGGYTTNALSLVSLDSTTAVVGRTAYQTNLVSAATAVDFSKSSWTLRTPTNYTFTGVQNKDSTGTNYNDVLYRIINPAASNITITFTGGFTNRTLATNNWSGNVLTMTPQSEARIMIDFQEGQTTNIWGGGGSR